MSDILILKSPGVTTDTTLPTLTKDTLLNSGSMFLYDFMRLSCWNPAVDTVADGATVGNLVTGAPSATLKIPVAGDLVFTAGKGFQLKSSTGLGRVNLGVGTSYFQSNLTNDMVVIAWVTYPAVDPTGHYGLILGKGTVANFGSPGPLLAMRYTGGGDVIGKMDASTGSGLVIANQGGIAGKHQIAIIKQGTQQLLYRDNVLIGTGTLGSPALTANGTVLTFGNGSAANQFACPSTILHRVYAEDLTVSGLTGASVIAADYAANSGRFS